MHAGAIDGSLRKAATDAGIRTLVYEAGEPLRFDDDAIQLGRDGVLRVLHALGMRTTAPRPRDAHSALIAKTSWVRALNSGILRLDVKLGAKVTAGQQLGMVADAFGDDAAPLGRRRRRPRHRPHEQPAGPTRRSGRPPRHDGPRRHRSDAPRSRPRRTPRGGAVAPPVFRCASRLRETTLVKSHAKAEGAETIRSAVFTVCVVVIPYSVIFTGPPEMPPSTSSVCPVTYALASDAKKTIAPSRSSGFPGRFSGIRSVRYSTQPSCS